jgi:hypothetical protein
MSVSVYERGRVRVCAQVVFRMYENKTVPVESAERFRVEVLFSPGANYNPFDFR